MTNMKHTVISLSLFAVGALAALSTAPATYADTCTTQYGNGQYGTTCVPTDLTIDKKVRNPITGVYVDNLLAGDAAYSPAGEVTYSLEIHNASNQDFTTVQVTDHVEDRLVNPKVDEPDQNLVTNVRNPDERTLIFVLKDTLHAGESRTVHVKSTVVSTFPADKTLFCGTQDHLQNNSDVTASDRHDQDSASICVVTNILGVTTLPTAGPEDYLPLLPFAGMGFAGIALFLKKK